MVARSKEKKIGLECVQKVFRWPELHNFQLETLTVLLKKRDALVSVKTGGGKSICYQGFVTAFADSLQRYARYLSFRRCFQSWRICQNLDFQQHISVVTMTETNQ